MLVSNFLWDLIELSYNSYLEFFISHLKIFILLGSIARELVCPFVCVLEGGGVSQHSVSLCCWSYCAGSFLSVEAVTYYFFHYFNLSGIFFPFLPESVPVMKVRCHPLALHLLVLGIKGIIRISWHEEPYCNGCLKC